MGRESLAEEIGELARIAFDLGQRHYVPVAERLAYHRRKAAVLTAIADRDRDPNTREVADLAWRRVAELETEQAGGEPEPEQAGKQYGYRRYASGSRVVGPIPRWQALARTRDDAAVVPVERPGTPGAWQPWADSAELARVAGNAWGWTSPGEAPAEREQADAGGQLTVAEVEQILTAAGVDFSALTITADPAVWTDMETGHASMSVIITGPRGARRDAGSVLYGQGLGNAPYPEYDSWSRRQGDAGGES